MDPAGIGGLHREGVRRGWPIHQQTGRTNAGHDASNQGVYRFARNNDVELGKGHARNEEQPGSDGGQSEYYLHAFTVSIVIIQSPDSVIGHY